MSDFLGADAAAADYIKYLAALSKEFAAILFSGENYDKVISLPLTGPRGLRQQLGELSLEYFARAYFPEYFTKPVGDFHRGAYLELSEILNTPPSRRRLVRGWPRSFAKSTIYNFFTPMHGALYHKRPFILQVSDTESQSASFLADMRTACETNEHLLQDFGNVQGHIWRSDTVVIKSSFGSSYIVAIGGESSVRGIRQAQYRPQLIIIDDLENDESVQTTERIEKRYKWLNRTLIPIGDDATDIIYVGTVLAYDCVFDRVLNSPYWDTEKYAAIVQWSNSPLWDEWKKMLNDLSKPKHARLRNARKLFAANHDEMLEGTVVLWDEGRPYETLMETMLEVGDLAFQAEYQNEPINPQDCIFDKAWYTFYSDDYIYKRNIKFVEYVAALDPSLGKSKLGDFTAFITLARGNDGVIYVVDTVIERLPPDRIIDMVLEKAKQYHYNRVGVEVNQFQELLKLELQREAARRQIYLPIVEMRHNKDKVLRVQSLVPYVKNKYVRFKGDQVALLDQLGAFPKGRHDDGPDALEMAVRLMGTGASFDAMETATDMREPRYLRQEEDEDMANYGLSWADF